MEGIKVPVSLEIVQSSIAAVKNAIANLKPNSKNWETLQGILRTMEREADRLAVTMSKPFTSEAQFTQAEKSIDKIDEALSKASLTMSRLKFSDIKLTPEQQATFDALNQQLVDIQNQIKSFKANAKAELQKENVWQDIIKIDPNAATRTFDELLKVVRKKNAELQSELQKAQEAANDFQKQDKAASFTEKVFKEADPLSDVGIGKENFERFFMPKVGKAGEFQFKSGQKSPFYEWVKENFTLTDEQLEQIKGKSGQQVIDLFRGFKEQALQKANETHETNAQKSAEVMEIAVKAASGEAAVSAMGEKVDQLATLQGNLAGKTAAATKQVEDFKNSTAQAARESQDFQSAEHQMQSALDQLRGTLNATNADFLRMQRVQQSFSQMKSAVVNFMGFSQVLNLTRKAIRGAIEHIRELDTVMNGIAIVTDMSTGDLWNQVDAYSKMAQSYGVSIKGAYEVSQIYYQQGLETADVMTLTNETLKLAKISGLDYATTTDYMTTALRGFKIEMQDAVRIVDVYSALAANTAVSQEELAVAMSKTASSMEGVGATFEEASAMIGTMVAVTRESATNIGSAMKSIASRYGELTKDPTKLVDEDGEAMAFNKVDAALQSVGISMKTVDGQFRNFTEVIIELGEKWNELDSTQQRYIATQFAGNRQQSRFLALVSNVDMLKSNLDVAMNSEDTGTLQALKALDSIESKTEQVRVAYQQFYTTIGAETVWKGFLDGAKDVINTLNSFPKLFGKLPIGALAAVGSIVNIIKSLGSSMINGLAQIVGSGLQQGMMNASNQASQGAETIFTRIINTIKSKLGLAEQTGKEIAQAVEKGASTAENQPQENKPINFTKEKQQEYKRLNSIFAQTENVKGNRTAKKAIESLFEQNLITEAQRSQMLKDQNGAAQGLQNFTKALREQNSELLKTGEASSKAGAKIKQFAENHQGLASGLQSFGSALNMVSLMINTSQPGMKTLSGSLMSLSGLSTIVGASIEAIGTGFKSIPWMAIASGIFSIINGISTLIITPEEKLKELEERAEDLNNKAKQSNAEYRTLDNSLKKLDELKEKRYESAEAAEEYQTAVEKLADEFPALITGFDEAGNIMIDTAEAESVLTEARKKAAQATYDAAQAEYEKIQQEIENKQKEVSEGKEGTASAGLANYIFRATGFDPTNTTPEIQAALKNLAPYITNNNGTPEKDINTREGRMALHNLGEALHAPGAFYGEQGDTEALHDLLDAWQTESQAMGNLTDLMNDRIGYARQIVSGWQKTADADTHAWAYLQESAGAAAMVTQVITDDLLTQGKEVSGANAAIVDAEKTYRTSMNNFISNLSDEKLKIFNDMYNTPDLYTSSDFETVFSEEKGWNDIVEKIITRNYDKIITNIREQLTERLNQSLTYIDEKGEQVTLAIKEGSFYDDYLNAIANVETRAQQKFLNNILQQYETLNKAGFISQAEDNGLAALKVFSKLNEIKIVDPQLFGSLSLAVSNYNLNTKTGIEEFISYLQTTETIDDDVIIESLENLKDTLSSNIALTIQSLTSSVVEGWKDDSATLLKLTSGLELTDVNSIITQASQLYDDTGNKLSFTIDDFQMNGDKLILPTEKAEAYWRAFFKAQEEKISSTETELDNALAAIGGKKLENQEIDLTQVEKLEEAVDSEIADFYKALLGESRFNKYFKAITDSAGNSTGEFEVLTPEQGELTLPEAVEEAYTENSNLIKQYYKYINWQRNQVQKTTDWAKGDYSSINEYLQENDTFESILKDKSKLSKYTETPEVKNAYKNATEAFSSLISDALSLGFDNILLDDYKGIFGITEQDLESYRKNENYVSFISKYAAFAGKSIDETNDLILQAVQKQNETSSEDLIKDIQFTKNGAAQFTQDTLGKLANAYNIPIQKLLVAFQHGFDSRTRTYTVGVQELLNTGIDLRSVENLRDTVQESVENLLDSITSQIKKALSGSLNIKERNEFISNLQLQGIEINEDWFTRTKEGYKLAYEQVAKIYDKLKAIDDISGQITLDILNESAEKSSSALLQRNKELEENIKYQKNLQKYEKATRESGVDLFDKLKAQGSQVDFYNRPRIDRGNGQYSTLSTATLDSRNFQTDAYWAMNITPIMANGKELSEDTLNEYVQDLIDKSGGDLEQIKVLDQQDRKLIIRLQESNAERIESDVNVLADEAQELHEVSEAFEAIVSKHDKYDSTKISQYEKELSLNREIMELRATTESDDFKFMENKIPSGQNNPLNYYENWGKAWKTIQEAGKNKNQIDYQDFYNIITEMGKLASDSNQIQVSGEHILTSAEDAANLIEQAGAALTVAADGSIKVDLGKLGIDFSAGADDMAKGVDDGIKEVAKSQIKMLDGMIQLMEAIVAMEELGDVAGEDNTINLSDILPNINIDDDGNLSIGKFSEGYETWRQKMIEQLKLTEKDKGYNKDLQKALKEIFVGDGENQVSLADIISWDETNFYGADESVKAGYMAILTAFQAAAKSGNYDLDNIMASVKEVLAGTGYEGTIELGDMKLLFTSNTSFTIDENGKVVTSDGKKFDNTDSGRKKAVKYTRETELETLKDMTRDYDETTDTVTFSNCIVTNVDYNMEEGVYDIHFSDGSVARATTKAGADLAILTYAKMTNQEIGTKADIGESTTFSLHIEGEVEANYTYSVTDGKVEIIKASKNADIEKALAAGQAAVDEQAQKVASGVTGNAEISNLSLSVAEGTNIEVDLSGAILTPVNAPEKIELNPIPSLLPIEEPMEVEVNNLQGSGSGVLDLGKCQLQLSQNGNVKVISGGTEVAEIPVQGLTGSGILSSCHFEFNPTSNNITVTNQDGAPIGVIPIPESLKGTGNLDNCTFVYDPSSENINILNSNNEIISSIPIGNNLTGVGTLDECSFTYDPNSDSVIITGINNEVIGSIPIPEGFYGEGTLEGCTFEYDPNNSNVEVISKNGESLGEIPVDGQFSGVGELGWCDLTYNPTSDNYSLTNISNNTQSYEIPSEWLTGFGILTANNCQVSLSGEILTLTAPSGQKIEVKVPDNILDANVQIDKSQCTVTFNPDGELAIQTVDGQIYTVKVPSESLSGIAELLGAKVQWAGGKENFDTTSLIPDSGIDLGETQGIVKVNVKYELSDNQKFINDYSADYLTKFRKEYRLKNNFISTTGIKDNKIVDEKAYENTKKYIDLIKTDVVDNKGILNKNNKKIIDSLAFAFDGLKNKNKIQDAQEYYEKLLEIQSISEFNSNAADESFFGLEGLSNIDFNNVESLVATLEQLHAVLTTLESFDYASLASKLNSLNVNGPSAENIEIDTGTTEINVTTTTDTSGMVAEIESAKAEATKEPATQKIEGDADDVIDAGKEATNTVNRMKASINIVASSSATSVINNIKSALTNLVNSGPYKVTVQANVSRTPGATGNLGGGPGLRNTTTLSRAKGTLMGELGPELVVSKGHYFVAGQNGPEMVNLADDAIVFNHLQTESLLTKGMSRGRGRAVTNERNAVSFATGNVNGGPAMASASAALATLKQLRAMWESLLGASVSDLAGAGGGGGGGGGGDKIVDPKAWVKTVERWYNLTQEIAKLEKDITHEETLRSKLQSDFNKNGTHYYNSQRLSLKALREQIAAQEQLNLSRQSYYTRRIDTLKNEPLGKLYTFDENGQMHFRNDVNMNGQQGAMNFLTDLMGFDKNGKANYTNEQKYNILKRYGFDEYMKYNSNGEQILLDADHSGDVTDEEKETYYQQATEAWRDRMDNFAQETQSLWDSIKEGENNLLELQTSQNELLQEMRDNQVEVEEEVLKAIEDMRQREIDALQDERDKLEDSTGKFIQGLSDALSREQEMYNDQQSENDLNQQRRRLAILQRSGGSAADIANLQKEINNNERSRYFDLQQKQIDAIQEASDLQLERMDDQIKLMTETLEYQKEYGLLWGNVYEVMNGSAAQITSFITHGNSEFWSKSPLATATAVNDILFKAKQWKGFREDMTDVTSDVSALAFPTREQMKTNDYKIFNEAMIKEFGADYDKNGTYKELFEKIYDETGDLTKANTAATDLTRAKYEEEAAKKLTDTINTNTAPVATTPATSSPSNDSNKCKGCAGECTKGCAYSCTGQCVKGCKGACGNDCNKGCAANCTGTCKGGPNDIDNPAKYQGTNRSSIPKKAAGGFVKHGIYELGEEGTEGVLNARQTRVLRENILSNKPNSLITLLNTYNEAYKDGLVSVPGQSGESFIIENATVNMNVQQIANDYDARRAGEQALNEMMRIARKTSAANSIRR